MNELNENSNIRLHDPILRFNQERDAKNKVSCK